MSDLSSRSDLGLTCVNCGQVNVGPNRDLDNWQCGYCYSGFLSMRMLNNLASREVLAQLNQEWAPISDKPPRACPNCERQMDFRGADLGGRELEVEICKHCRLVWFDSGDLLRALRAKKNDTLATKEDIISERSDRQTERVLKRQGKDEWATEEVFPTETVSLLVISALVLTLSAHFAGFNDAFGFSPARPFRLFGATWLSSFFLHKNYLDFLTTLVWFLCVGTFVEQKLSRGQYLRLFVVAGLVARFQYLIGGTFRDPIFMGLRPSILAITAYAACVFPYRRIFFPNAHKWRSPREKIFWALAFGGAVLGFLIAWDFTFEAIHQFGLGRSGDALERAALENSMWGKIGRYFGNNLFRAHAAGFAVGLLWKMGESIDSRRVKQ